VVWLKCLKWLGDRDSMYVFRRQTRDVIGAGFGLCKSPCRVADLFEKSREVGKRSCPYD
jgi:hypothetical protein